MYNWIENKLYQLSNPLHTIYMKIIASYIYNKCIYINIFDKQKWWGKKGEGIDCKCKISS